MMVYIFDVMYLKTYTEYDTERVRVTGVPNLAEAYKKAAELSAGKYVDSISLVDRYRE